MEFFGGKAKRLRVRTLFQIRTNEHPTHGVLYRAYAGGDTEVTSEAYSCSYFVSQKNGQFKVLARYSLGLEWTSEQIANGPLCGWHYNTGESCDGLGPVMEIRRIKAPDEDDQLVEFEAE